jgi:hypothetical protein
MDTVSNAPSSTFHLDVDRFVGIMGGLTVLVATGLPWYVRHLSVNVAGLANRYTTGFTIWDVRNTASWLIVVGVSIGLVALLLPAARERKGGLAACAAGFGVILYGLISLFVVPDLGSAALVGPNAAARVTTTTGVGPFVAIAGGFLLIFGGAAIASDAVTAAAGAPAAQPTAG